MSCFSCLACLFAKTNAEHRLDLHLLLAVFTQQAFSPADAGSLVCRYTLMPSPKGLILSPLMQLNVLPLISVEAVSSPTSALLFS